MWNRAVLVHGRLQLDGCSYPRLLPEALQWCHACTRMALHHAHTLQLRHLLLCPGSCSAVNATLLLQCTGYGSCCSIACTVRTGPVFKAWMHALHCVQYIVCMLHPGLHALHSMCAYGYSSFRGAATRDGNEAAQCNSAVRCPALDGD